MMAFAAALADGYDAVNDYDFQVVAMPFCSAQGFGGVGWVGVPGTVQATQAYDYDAAVAHELVRDPAI